MRTFDVVVIGGGAAGVAAALAARSRGASVALIRAAPGASAVGSGEWNGPLPPIVANALADAGLLHVPAPHPLPHPAGDLRTADYAAASHAAPFPIDSALLCGIAGLAGFVAPALARLYATSADRPLLHTTAVLPGTPPAGWATLALAAAIERDPAIVAAAVAAAVSDAVTHLLFPAVLGLEDGDTVRTAIAERVGRPVFECLGAPPSIPGWRLDRALVRALHNAGVTLVTGRVHAASSDNRRITSIQYAPGEASLAADHFVLATGKFLGGGIATRLSGTREQALVETALDLPVWVEHLDQTFNTAESLTLTSRVRTYDQPMLRAGVHVNGARQPIDARTRVIYDNVIAVGSVLADTDANELGLGFATEAAVAAIHDTIRSDGV